MCMSWVSFDVIYGRAILFSAFSTSHDDLDEEEDGDGPPVSGLSSSQHERAVREA